MPTRKELIASGVEITPLTREEILMSGGELTPLNVKEKVLSGIVGGGIEPTGTITITENGTGIDVSEYATADVNVEADVQVWTCTIVNNTGTKIDLATYSNQSYQTTELTGTGSIPVYLPAINGTVRINLYGLGDIRLGELSSGCSLSGRILVVEQSGAEAYINSVAN